MKKTIYTIVISIILISNHNVKAQWSCLGGYSTNGLGANNSITSICSDNSGNIYATGLFSNSSGRAYVAKFNGTYWSELGGTNSFASLISLTCICTDSFGNVYAGGRFHNSSGFIMPYVAKFNGNTWNQIGGINGFDSICVNYDPNTGVSAISVDKSGNIYVSGNIKKSTGNYIVAKYDGNLWSELGGTNSLGANNSISSICLDNLGNLYAAGFFKNINGHYFVAKYNGTSWSELGGLNSLSADSNILSVQPDINGNIYASGYFTNSSNKFYVAKYDGISWLELGGINSLGANGFIKSIYIDTKSNVYVGGNFHHYNSSQKIYLAMFDGSGWSELGGNDNFPTTGGNVINTICGDNKGNIYVAGSFYSGYISGGKPYVAKFSNASGLDNFSFINIVNIYPNPTNTGMTITLTKSVDNATIKLISLTGQTIIEKQNQRGDHFNLDISQQAQGIYFVEIRQVDNVWRTKLVKQ